MEPDDRCLIEQAKQHNERAFLALIQSYLYIVVAIIRQYIHNIIGYEEEDLTQEITLAAYEIMPRFRGDELSFQCWLRRSTKGLCLNILEKQRRQEMVELDVLCRESYQQALPNPFPTPDTAMNHKEIAASVQQAMSELPEHYRKIVMLKDIDGLRYYEIARVLGIEEGTVKSQLSRARTLLREKLQPLRSAKG